jgi:hypothetical protein
MNFVGNSGFTVAINVRVTAGPALPRIEQLSERRYSGEAVSHMP